MRTATTLLIIGLLVLIVSCTGAHGEEHAHAAPSTSADIPALVPRTVAVGLPGENEQLKATYTQLKQQLTQRPGDLKSWLKLSEVFITEARITGNYGPNYDAALSILDHVLDKTGNTNKSDPNLRGEALTLKAVIKLSQHQFEEARVLGLEAVKLDPHRAFNYGVLVDANVELGDYPTAVAMSDKMVSTRPDLRSYSRVSYLREIHGDPQGAIAAMDMAVKAGYPGTDETSWCRLQLGGLHERLGDLDAAAAQYAQTLVERPDYPFALAASGRVNGKRKNYGKAEAELKKALSLMPDAHFHVELARIYKAQGRNGEYTLEVQKAEEALIGLSGDGTHHHAPTEDAAKAHGHSHEVGLEMARFELEFHHDLPAALKNAEHEFEHREKNIDVNAAMAAILYEQGDLASATVHLNMAKATGSKSADLLLLEGLITARKGSKAEGVKLIRQAFQRDPYLQHPLAPQGRVMI